jgi:CRP-like cAMP-binding protein
MKKNKGAS